MNYFGLLLFHLGSNTYVHWNDEPSVHSRLQLLLLCVNTYTVAHCVQQGIEISESTRIRNEYNANLIIYLHG